ncbi:MAG: hypothetical protein V4543_09110 [Bacteroidota bacterium]
MINGEFAFTHRFNFDSKKRPLIETPVYIFPAFISLNLQMQNWPHGEEVIAVWDTGASHTAISSRLAKLLKPEV